MQPRRDRPRREEIVFQVMKRGDSVISVLKDWVELAGVVAAVSASSSLEEEEDGVEDPEGVRTCRRCTMGFLGASSSASSSSTMSKVLAYSAHEDWNLESVRENRGGCFSSLEIIASKQYRQWAVEAMVRWGLVPKANYLAVLKRSPWEGE